MASSTSAEAVDPDVVRTLRLGGAPRVRKIAIRVALVAAAVLAVVLAARWWQQRGARSAPAFVTTPLTRGDLVVTVTATGTLEATNQVTIGSEVSGRIAKLHVDVNDRVTRGQVIAEIDPELLAAQVEQARAQLAQARAQLAQARATRRETRVIRTRTEGLVAAGVAAEQERDAAVAAAERAVAAEHLAAASVEQAEAALRLSRSNLERAVVRSPIDGIVLSREVEVGQTVVSAFQSPVLFVIAEDLRAMRAAVDVDEADVGEVREGATATFTVAAYLGRTFAARVVTVHNAAKLVDRVVTYEAELAVDNADLSLRPGMTVTASIVARRVSDALLVPSQALRFTPAGETDAVEGDQVWVLRDGRPVAVAVTVTGENDTHAAVTAPELASGAPVIVNKR